MEWIWTDARFVLTSPSLRGPTRPLQACTWGGLQLQGMVPEIVTPVIWTDVSETEAGTGEDAGAGHPVPSGGGGLAPGASHPGGRGDTEEEEDLGRY